MKDESSIQPERTKISVRAVGKWKSILEALGFAPQVLDPRKHHPCPVTGQGDNRFRFSNKNGKGSYFCACNNGKGDGFELLKCKFGWDYATAAREVEKVIEDCVSDEAEEGDTEAALRDLKMIQKKAAEAPNRDHVTMYLRRRGIKGLIPAAVQQAHLWYGLKAIGIMKPQDAMVCKFVTADGRPSTYHLTYLADGYKANHERQRVIATSCAKMGGGAVRLTPMGADGVLGVAEGVETALAASQLFGVPVWAALNATMMMQFKPPPGCKRLMIFGDNDKSFTGHAASYHLAKACQLQHKVIADVRIPDEIDTDWNDVLMEKRK